jgi:hypothetical protein
VRVLLFRLPVAAALAVRVCCRRGAGRHDAIFEDANHADLLLYMKTDHQSLVWQISVPAFA